MQKKYGEGKVRTHDLLAGKHKKFQAPARVRTHDLLAGKAKNEVRFTQWSGDKVEFWQNWLKKRLTEYDFPPPFMWSENNKPARIVQRQLKLEMMHIQTETKTFHIR